MTVSLRSRIIDIKQKPMSIMLMLPCAEIADLERRFPSPEENEHLTTMKCKFSVVLSADYQMSKLIPFWGASSVLAICDRIWENPYAICMRFAQFAFLVARVQICHSPKFVISMSNNPSNCSCCLLRLVVSYKGEISLSTRLVCTAAVYGACC